MLFLLETTLISNFLNKTLSICTLGFIFHIFTSKHSTIFRFDATAGLILWHFWNDWSGCKMWGEVQKRRTSGRQNNLSQNGHVELCKGLLHRFLVLIQKFQGSAPGGFPGFPVSPSCGYKTASTTEGQSFDRPCILCRQTPTSWNK